MKLDKRHFIQEPKPIESEYNDHKVLFEGWDVAIGNHVTQCDEFYKNDNMIVIYYGGNMVIYEQHERVYSGVNDLELVRMICKINDIDL